MVNLRNRQGLSFIIILIVLAAIAGTVAVALNFFGGSSVSDLPQSDSSTLPNLYTQAGLPVYPNGTVTDSRQGDILQAGVQVTWETSDDMATITSFFDSEMISRGFTSTDVLPGNEFASYAVYTDGNKRFSLTVTKIGETSDNKIHVVYSEP
ncbi:MAG: hypothetical protein BMS9Abin34_111 [Patescibacteria group bacterium]|nr:MAG: hypothetical protein BMS9Abin34_111 [Patescibacteria group bacterium]